MIGLRVINLHKQKVIQMIALDYYFPPEPGINLADIIPNASPEAIDLI